MKLMILFLTLVLSTTLSFSQTKTRLDSIWGKGKCVSGNCQNGVGEYYIPWMKATYKGDFKDGMFHGQGAMTFPKALDSRGIMFDPGYYKGGWERGEKSGYGVQDFGGSDDAILRHVYKGQWKNGLEDGFGRMEDVVNNEWQEGMWKQGHKIGWFIWYGVEMGNGKLNGFHHFKVYWDYKTRSTKQIIKLD
jgi:hypothetical protein